MARLTFGNMPDFSGGSRGGNFTAKFDSAADVLKAQEQAEYLRKKSETDAYKAETARAQAAVDTQLKLDKEKRERAAEARAAAEFDAEQQKRLEEGLTDVVTTGGWADANPFPKAFGTDKMRDLHGKIGVLVGSGDPASIAVAADLIPQYEKLYDDQAYGYQVATASGGLQAFSGLAGFQSDEDLQYALQAINTMNGVYHSGTADANSGKGGISRKIKLPSSGKEVDHLAYLEQKLAQYQDNVSTATMRNELNVEFEVYRNKYSRFSIDPGLTKDYPKIFERLEMAFKTWNDNKGARSVTWDEGDMLSFFQQEIQNDMNALEQAFMGDGAIRKAAMEALDLKEKYITLEDQTNRAREELRNRLNMASAITRGSDGDTIFSAAAEYMYMPDNGAILTQGYDDQPEFKMAIAEVERQIELFQTQYKAATGSEISYSDAALQLHEQAVRTGRAKDAMERGMIDERTVTRMTSSGPETVVTQEATANDHGDTRYSRDRIEDYISERNRSVAPPPFESDVDAAFDNLINGDRDVFDVQEQNEWTNVFGAGGAIAFDYVADEWQQFTAQLGTAWNWVGKLWNDQATSEAKFAQLSEQLKTADEKNFAHIFGYGGDTWAGKAAITTRNKEAARLFNHLRENGHDMAVVFGYNDENGTLRNQSLSDIMSDELVPRSIKDAVYEFYGHELKDTAFDVRKRVAERGTFAAEFGGETRGLDDPRRSTDQFATMSRNMLDEIETQPYDTSGLDELADVGPSRMSREPLDDPNRGPRQPLTDEEYEEQTRRDQDAAQLRSDIVEGGLRQDPMDQTIDAGQVAELERAFPTEQVPSDLAADQMLQRDMQRLDEADELQLNLDQAEAVTGPTKPMSRRRVMDMEDDFPTEQVGRSKSKDMDRDLKRAMSDQESREMVAKAIREDERLQAGGRGTRRAVAKRIAAYLDSPPGTRPPSGWRNYEKELKRHIEIAQGLIGPGVLDGKNVLESFRNAMRPTTKREMAQTGKKDGPIEMQTIVRKQKLIDELWKAYWAMDFGQGQYSSYEQGARIFARVEQLQAEIETLKGRTRRRANSRENARNAKIDEFVRNNPAVPEQELDASVLDSLSAGRPRKRRD